MMDQNFKLFINSANSGYMLCAGRKAEEASRTRVRSAWGKFNACKANPGSGEDPKVDILNFLYRSHLMVMLIFQEFQKVHITLLLQKHAFWYVHYLTTQSDPSEQKYATSICHDIYNKNWRRHARKIKIK